MVLLNKCKDVCGLNWGFSEAYLSVNGRIKRGFKIEKELIEALQLGIGGELISLN